MGSAKDGFPPLGKVSKFEDVVVWNLVGLEELFDSPGVKAPGVLVDPETIDGDVTDPRTETGELLVPGAGGDFRLISVGCLERFRSLSLNSFRAAEAVAASSRAAIPIFFIVAAAASSSQPFRTESWMNA